MYIKQKFFKTGFNLTTREALLKRWCGPTKLISRPIDILYKGCISSCTSLTWLLSFKNFFNILSLKFSNIQQCQKNLTVNIHVPIT